jgi:ferrous-iron efflux pump FieF
VQAETGKGNAAGPDRDAGISLLREKEHSLRTSLYFLITGLIIKIFTTILGGSLTQVTDLSRSFSETLAVAFSLISLRKTARGSDDIHHFGYGKLESLASLSVAAVILVSFIVVIAGMALRITNPPTIGNLGYGFLFAIISLCVDLYFWRRNYQLSLQEQSPVMESQWRLFRTKVLVNTCVILTLGASMLFRNNPGVIYIDILGSAAVGCFMLFTAYRLLTSSVYELIDGTLDESLQIIILRELASFFHEYDQFHGLKSRRSGTEVYIDVYLEFDPARPMGEVQSVIGRMRASMESSITNSHVNIIPATSPVK